MAVWVLLLAPAPSQAQRSASGTPYGLHVRLGAALPTVTVAPSRPAWRATAPSADSVRLLPDVYGSESAFHLDVKRTGTAHRLPDGGTLWRVRVRAPAARALRFTYDRFRLPPGATLFVYDPDGQVVRGAFTARNMLPHGGFATDFTPGNTAILEYYEPPAPAFPGRIRVNAVVQRRQARPAIPPLSNDDYHPTALSCSINTACPEAQPWSEVARATVRIDRGGSTCSGVLLNNTAEDFSPYILTAHHCGSPAVGDTLDWVVTFNYASAACPLPETQPPMRSMVGVVVRAAQSGWREDYALLELLNPIPPSYAPYYAGWSIENTTPASSASLGHPRGDIRKIAFENDPLLDLGERWVATFDRGTIESGSSGSPLFDEHQRVVGHVRGAWSIDLEQCSGPGGDDNAATIVFPKLAHIWAAGAAGEQVRDFLDPGGTGTTVLDGLDGRHPSTAPMVWINEIDTRTAETAEADDAEFIEVAGPAGQSLDGYAVDVYTCTAGRAERQYTETITNAPPLANDHDGTGFFVIGGPGLPDEALDQSFTSSAPNRLADGAGLIVLRAPSGREVFDYQYDNADGPSGACPASRMTRSRGDDYAYEPPPAQLTNAPGTRSALGSTAIGFQQSAPPSATALGTDGIVPTPGLDNDTAMPVQLTRFEALADGRTVRLTWATASETNNAGFEVQHAIDGAFVPRAFVSGHGTTTQPHTYAFTTSPLVAGTHRFRLKQVDTDGTTSFSPEVRIRVEAAAPYALTAPTPNPTHSTASMTLTVAEPQHVEAVLYDVLGRRVATLYDRVTPAHHPIPLRVDAQTVPSGLYIVRLRAERFTASRKLTVLR